MAKTLDVYLGPALAGHFVQTIHGAVEFQYTAEWLANPRAVALSLSLPLREEPFSAAECKGFFGGVLPEQSQRDGVAYVLGISKRNDFAMLEKIGGECAGAVSFMHHGEPLPSPVNEYRKLTSDDLAKILRELPRRPLLAGEDGVRLSLAGAQSIIAVAMDDEGFSVPLGGSPSTHILKSAAPGFPGIVANEAFCMRLARAIGLNVAKAEDRRIEDIDYLLVERYDRLRNPADGSIQKVHQEDFCQALGVPSDNKYQNEGGPSLAQCFGLLRDHSSIPALDLRGLLDAVLFNFFVGNNDAHGKNFSLLYTRGASGRRQVRLAPLYDLVSTLAYPELSRKMAMKIGGEYAFDKIFSRHFEKLAEEVGLSKVLVRRRALELAEQILKQIPVVGGGPSEVVQVIVDRCEQMI